MGVTADFNILEKIGESLYSKVYKVKDKGKEGNFHIFKLIKPEYRYKGMTDSLNRQIQQFSNINLPKFRVPVLYSTDEGEICLLHDLFPGFTLDKWHKSVPDFNLSAFLRLAINLAAELAGIHGAGSIHKGLKPSNILVQPDTFNVRIIDNVRVLDMNQLSHFIFNDYFRCHTLPYISPEMTGKICYSIDYTSDLYSLGTIFYEIAGGKPPFINEDPLEIIYSHLAEIPVSLTKINPYIPVQLDKIILRLLEKLPEKRYQTAAGLKYDLEVFLNGVLEYDAIRPFDLGTRDYASRITIPSIMVGRDNEKVQLLREYEMVCKGDGRGAIISGFSGVGKTRLIQELQLPIVAARGYYTSGKFDQFQKHIPYATLIQALRHLVCLFLTEEKDRILFWKKRILSATGNNCQLIIDIVPEVELITGSQPLVPDLPPFDGRNRFNDTLSRFIASFASKEHPLTIFIDDLQWCDDATLAFFEILFTDIREYSYVFWIGAYRHNEVDETHGLIRLFEKIKKKEASILHIYLDPLEPEYVNEMIAHILNTDPRRVVSLSKVIYKVSGGNPLFISETLRWMYDRNHLNITEKGTWKWNEDQMRHSNLPESAMELFKDKIERFPEKTVDLLKIAALLGADFEAKDLARVAGLEMADLYAAIHVVISQNILRDEKTRLTFFHDQIQQGADSLLTVEERRGIHAKIAESMISAIPEGADIEAVDNLFKIVKHLAMGRSADQSIEEKNLESRFNYYAGTCAMNAQAIDNAYYFFKDSMALYPHETWENDYDFLFKLYQKMSRVTASIGRQEEAEMIIDTLLTNAKSDLDSAECLAEYTTTLSSLGNLEEAIKTGNVGLLYFNKSIPDSDSRLMEKVDELFKSIHQGNRDVWQEILDTEPSAERGVLIETSIYRNLLPVYYLANMKPQTIMAALYSLENCFKGGINPSVIYTFAALAFYAYQRNLSEIAFKYEDLAFTLAKRYSGSFGVTHGINGFLWVSYHTRHSADDVIEKSWDNISDAKKCGDLINAGLSYAIYVWTFIIKGEDMKQAGDILDEYVRFSDKFNISVPLSIAMATLVGWQENMDINRENRGKDEIESLLKKWEDDKHIAAIASYYISDGVAQYYFGNFSQAIFFLKKAEPFLISVGETILYRIWHVFMYVSILRSHGKNGVSIGDKESAELADICLKRVSIWAGLGPILKPYLFLMKMEHARSLNDFSEARRLCLDGMDLAHGEGYIFLKGYLNQSLGEMLEKRGNDQAVYFLNQAIASYHVCKAEVMADKIKTRIGSGREKREKAACKEIPLNKALDIDYLFNATKTITGETDLNKLIRIILEYIMARLGAATGYLLIAEEKALFPYVFGVKEKKVLIKFKDEPGFLINRLSMGIARYVFRTKKILLLEDAFKEGEFVADEIVQREKLRSVLCIPLIKQKEVLGILYLENSLIKSVFTDDQVDFASLLTGQAAIALQNAVLLRDMKYAHETIKQMNQELEDKVKARTRELDMVNEDLNEFAHVVSHDLKAPLRGIIQLAGWMTDDYKDLIDKDGREILFLLESRARRMHSMINGILKYSRAGRINEHPRPVNLNRLVKDAAELIGMPKSFTLSILTSLPVIRCEETLVFQVFQNLFDNAVKYMDKEKGRIDVNCIEKDFGWQFCVADNGPGIDEKDSKKVFQIFQALGSEAETDSTGIGLALVEKIINKLGGRVWLESEVGNGSKFFFTIPKNH